MTKKTQKYSGRVFDRGDLWEVLAIQTGMLTNEEIFGDRCQRYTTSLRARILIALHRARGSTAVGGLGYGYDWKGVRSRKWPDGRVETMKCTPLKDTIREYLDRDTLPYFAVEPAAKGVADREMLVWALRRVRSKRSIRKQKQQPQLLKNGDSRVAPRAQ